MNPVLDIVAGSLVFGLACLLGVSIAVANRPKRWVRPIELEVLDPAWLVEMLEDQIARHPAHARGVVDKAGVKITACWVTRIEYGDPWGSWRLSIDDWQVEAMTQEAMHRMALARLTLIANARDAAKAVRVSA